MEPLPITEAKNRFTELAARASEGQDHFTVTRNGRPYVVVVSIAEIRAVIIRHIWQFGPSSSQTALAEIFDGPVMSFAFAASHVGANVMEGLTALWRQIADDVAQTGGQKKLLARGASIGVNAAGIGVTYVRMVNSTAFDTGNRRIVSRSTRRNS